MKLLSCKVEKIHTFMDYIKGGSVVIVVVVIIIIIIIIIIIR